MRRARTPRSPPKSRGSGSRGSGRRPRRWLRWGAIAGVAALGGAIAVGIARVDPLEDTLREITLPLRHDDIIRQQSREKDVDADLIAAVIYVESRFRDQTSEAGARGLMQITPATADEIERQSGGETFVYEDLANPDLNIRYGTFYLRYLLDFYGGNEVAALAAYNAGQTNVAGWGGAALGVEDIEFEETRDYVEDVLQKRDEYRRHYAKELGLD
jgi:soluble lytic murein transglycosylase